MRVAFITWEYPPVIVGGLGTYSYYMTLWMSRLGHDVEVYAPLPLGSHHQSVGVEKVEVNWVDVPDLSAGLRHVVNDEVKGWGEGVRFFSNIVTFNAAVSSRMVSKVLGGGFDVIAFNDWLCALSGISLSSLGKVSTVYHVHSTEWGRTMGRGSKTVSEIERHGAEYASIIITVSNAMKDDLQVHGWPGDKIRVVWNGVDPDVYDPSSVSQQERESLRQRYGIGADENMILFVGRLVHVKGVEELVQAMPHILSEFPNTKLVILGKGELEGVLHNLVRDLGLRDRVILRTEFVSERERIIHYAAADVCVFPSIYEPFGIVSLEAMAMERPVVVGARGVVGFREQVIPSGENQCGMHVDGSNPLDIAWGVKEVLRDPDRARRMGRNGRRRVLEEFTWRRAAEKTLEVYGQLIQVQRA